MEGRLGHYVTGKASTLCNRAKDGMLCNRGKAGTDVRQCKQ